jgi:hypothetical protein
MMTTSTSPLEELKKGEDNTKWTEVGGGGGMDAEMR